MPINPSDTSTSAAMLVQSRRRRTVSSRSSSDGLISRTCSSGTIEKSSDTRTPITVPCAAAPAVTVNRASANSDAVEIVITCGIAATATRAIATPSRLPARPSANTCSM